MKLSKRDSIQLKERGISVAALDEQLQLFKTGIAPIELVRSAQLNDGIRKIEDKDFYIDLYNSAKNKFEISKFVPASGAATRMFKFLFEHLLVVDQANKTEKQSLEIDTFLNNIEKFPFYSDLIEKAQIAIGKYDFDNPVFKSDLIRLLLDEDGLNYGQFPKALIPFHNYNGKNATPFEAHLLEALKLLPNTNRIKVHFTINETHRELFKAKLNEVLATLEDAYHVKIEVSFSNQNANTDTLAVSLNNEPLRDANNNLVFRPSGHGALLENLNALDSDIVFIKNIDNVVSKSHLDKIVTYKSVLGGVLIEAQSLCFKYAKLLDTETPSNTDLETITEFLHTTFYIDSSKFYDQANTTERISLLKSYLNRPIRVSGMVKNVGDPGGGPFWVKDSEGNLSLQIVESAQVDQNCKKQLSVFKSGTHFNPVDLVCGFKNYKGEKYNLTDYVDNSTGFITIKTKAGTKLKALERPGLWNGSMAKWNTIFVDVPLITFNPVKTVNDLLKPMHQTQ